MKNITLILTLLFLQLFHCTKGLGNLKSLREQSKHLKDNIQVFNQGKQGASMKFTAKTDFLYPGLDKRKLDKVKRLWKDYYDCQQAMYEASRRLVVPKALAFLEGSNTVLECEVCESPRDIFTPTRWFYSPEYNMNKVFAITDSPTIFLRNDSLYIYNVEDTRGGLYMCRKGDHSARPYVVNIFSKESTTKVVPEHNKSGPHPAPDTALPELNATVTTSWAEWTQCSRCDHTGKRYRTGICTVVANKYMTGFRTKRKTFLPPAMVKSLHLSNQTLADTSTWVAEGENINRNKTPYHIISSIEATTTYFIDTDKHLALGNVAQAKHINETLQTSQIVTNITIKKDLELLDMFEEGIPCRSQLLSEYTHRLKAISERNSEVMVAYCKLSCPKSVLFVVVDDHGEVIETANNSAGIYSVKQGLPREFPAVSRAVQFAVYGKPYKIQCPGNRNGDIPIEWYVGKKLLTNSILENETNGRVKIDEYNRIIIQSVLYEDSRVFSCWQRNELVGTVRLLVEKEHFILNFQSPVTVIGTLVIFATFAWVYYKAFTFS